MRQLRWLSGSDSEDYDPLTKKIIENNGSVDEQSLEEYGATAGAMGGAAVCVAFGVSAGAAAVCGMIGGKIGAWIASQIPWAKGSTINDAIADSWAQAVARNKKASKGILAVKAYITYRNSMPVRLGLKSSAKLFAEMDAIGLHDIPIMDRWKPVPGRWEAAQEMLTKGPSPQECNIVKKTMDCGLYWLFLNIPYGPVGKFGTDVIDWSLVGQDEVWAGTGQKLWLWVEDSYSMAPSQPPSKTAALWLKALKEFEEKKKKDLVKMKMLQIIADQVLKPKPKTTSPVVKAAAAGGIGYGIWWLWKTFK